jgi:hypothetical protein
MWRYPFVNLCFVVVVVIVLALQHSAPLFGPKMHDPWMWDGEYLERLHTPATLDRAAAFLDDAWHRGMVFKEWLMEYNASQWEIFNASSPAETDLLEAKFHVANAEVFTDAMGENDRALKELVRAETSLQAAQTIVRASLATQLTTIRKEIAAAENSEQSADDSSTVPFEAIKTELDHLLGILRVSKT